MGIWQSATHRLPGQWLRAHGFFHPVTFGEVLALTALGALCYLGSAEATKNGKRAAAGFLAATGAGLLFNQTRAAMLGLAVGFASVCWLKPRLRRWIVPVAAALGALGLLWEFMPTGGRSFSDLLHASQQGRLEMWSAAWRMFLDHPLTGVGPGNYNELFARYAGRVVENQATWGSAHDLYLHQLAERGLVGGAALLSLLGVMTREAWRRAKASAAARDLWAWGAMIAFLFMNLTEVAFQNELVTTLLLFIWCWSAAGAQDPSA
jgi:O-antigen ligase